MKTVHQFVLRMLNEITLEYTWVTLKVSGFSIILIDIYDFGSCGGIDPSLTGKSAKFWILIISPFVLSEIK